MVVRVTSKCKFPHDLNFAIKQLEDEIGSRLLDNQQLLKDAESLLPGMNALLDTGNNILNDILKANGAGTPTSSNITTGSDVSDQYGLLPDNPTTQQQEEFLANAGITLIDGVVYLSGDMSTDPTNTLNIENLRRLYFAVGRDLVQTEKLILSSKQTIFVHDSLSLAVIPAKSKNKAYSLAEIRTMTSQNYLTKNDIAVTADYRTVVSFSNYIALNKSKMSTLSSFETAGISSSQLISNVFHLNGVDSSPTAVSRYMSLDYTGEELNAILTGQDYVASNYTGLLGYVDELHADAAKIIPKLEWLEKVLTKNPDGDRFGVKSEFYDLAVPLGKLMDKHKALISATLFKVVTDLQTDIIAKLRTKHTDDMIKYMLEQRPDILGVYFDPPDDLLMGYISKISSSCLPGTTYISNKAVNKIPDILDQQVMLQMYCDLLDATQYLDTRTKKNVTDAKNALYHYMNLTPLPMIEYYQPVIQGQPSAASPGSILAPNFDVGKTMDIEKRKNNVYGTFKELNDMYGKDISGPLTEIIMSIVDFYSSVFKSIDSVIAKAEKTLFAFKNRLDAWLSKQSSLTGQGNFNSSLLKCAINWDISLSLPLLDTLFTFVMNIMAKVLAILSKLKAWISDILTKLLCYPVNILNSLIGKFQVALPSACRLPKFDLPANMTDALTKLMNCSSTKSIVLQALSKDLAKIQLAVSAAPDRLGQFQSSALCESSATSNFMNASILNVGVGV